MEHSITTSDHDHAPQKANNATPPQQESPGEPGSVASIAQLKAGMQTLADRVYGRVVRKPIAVLMIVAVILVFGVVSLSKLSLTLMPDLNYPSLTIRTDYPTATPRQVEQRVSEPIEERIANVAGLVNWTSFSRAEQSDVVLEFDWGTDMFQASAMVGEALDRVRLDRSIERPRVLRYDPSQDPIMRLMLYARGPGVTQVELRKYADDVLKPELQRLSGVAAVRIAGGVEQQLRIKLKEHELKRYQLDVRDIRSAIENSNVDQTAGLLYMHGREVLLRVRNPYNSERDVRDLDINTPQNVPLKLKDLADIIVESKERETITRYAAPGTEFEAQEGVLLEVLKQGDANIVETAHQVWTTLYGNTWQSVRESPDAYPNKAERDKRAEALRERGLSVDRPTEFGMVDRLPERFGMNVISDQSVFIERAVGEVRDAVIFGGILAIVIIFLFLRSVWSTFLIAVSIPLSVAAAFVPMQGFGLNLNLMTLGGLALGIGMLVDNSIVVLESIARCREEGDSPLRAASRGTSEVASAIVASTLTTVAVFFPIAFVDGMAGQIFRDQALTVVFSLLASLVVALLVIPAYAGLATERISIKEGVRLPLRTLNILRMGTWPRDKGKAILLCPFYIVASTVALLLFVVAFVVAAVLMIVFSVAGAFVALVKFVSRFTVFPLVTVWQQAWRGLDATYPVVLRAALSQPLTTIGVALGLAVMAGVLGMQLPTELLPPLSENEVYVDVALPEGTRLDNTDAEVRELIANATDDPAISGALRVVLAESGGDNDVSGRQIGSDRARLVLNVDTTKATADEVGQHFRATARVQAAIGNNAEINRPTLFTLRAPITVEIRGANLELLQNVADRVLRLLQSLQREDGAPLLKEVRSSTERGKPQIPIVWDRLKLTQLGLNSQALADTLRLKLAGDVISEVEKDAERIDIFVDLADRQQYTLESLKTIEVAPGIQVQDVIDAGTPLRQVEGPSQILRTGNERMIEIRAEPNGVALGAARAQIDRALVEARIETEGARLRLGGQQAELEQSEQSLIFALLLAIFLVYVVMAIQFESLVDPLLIMGTLPLASVGVVLILWLTATPLSVVAMLGIIILAGIVVNNAIVLVDYANQLRARGMSVSEAIQTAGRARLRPIAITTLTTVLGMLPLTGWLDGPLNLLSSLIPIESISNALVSTGEGREVRAPMAMTVVVGLSASTLLTLLVIPTLYKLAHRDPKQAA